LIKEFEVLYNKRVKLEIKGGEVQLDKLMLESLSEQIIHLIRNCVVYGIESADVRAKRGKPEQGTIKINCYYNHGFINIDISDDGEGVDKNFYADIAVKKGVVTKEEAKNLTLKQINELILISGLTSDEKFFPSSADVPGLDTIKLNIERLGGSFGLDSVHTQGVKVSLKIPPTFSIIQALIFRSRSVYFALPEVAVHELLIVRKGDEKVQFEIVDNFCILKFRGKQYPLLHLKEDLRINSIIPDDDYTKVLIVSVDNYQYGLIIDELLGLESIIVKSLPNFLTECLVYSGISVLASGDIGLILNTAGIATRAGIRFLEIKPEEEKIEPETKEEAPKHKILLFSSSNNKLFGIEFGVVRRVEKLAIEEIIKENDGEYVEYEGARVRLVDCFVSEARSDITMTSRDQIQVIIIKEKEKYLGIVCDKVIDNIETELDIKRDKNTPKGFLGSCKIGRNDVLFPDFSSL
jgi:chemotaxis protein histidine kinase CheA